MKRLLVLLIFLALAGPANGAHSGGGRWTALVTAETQNQLVAVDLVPAGRVAPGGRVEKRIHLPADPENVDARPGVPTAVVVSTRGAAVSLIGTQNLRVKRILHGFSSPHIPAITPSGRYAYVTDDGSGKLNVIDLKRRRLVRRVFVGLGAHHLAISPNGRRTWIALGEHARRIVILNTSRPARPRVVGHLDPRGISHDLAFTPSGARVWVTSADSSRVAIYDARTHRLTKTFAAGSPPQHVAFSPFPGHALAYVTSGYGGKMQLRYARSGRLRRTVRTDYGSFNLAQADGLVVTSSLLRGTVTELDGLHGRRMGQWHIAPAARDVAIIIR